MIKNSICVVFLCLLSLSCVNTDQGNVFIVRKHVSLKIIQGSAEVYCTTRVYESINIKSEDDQAWDPPQRPLIAEQGTIVSSNRFEMEAYDLELFLLNRSEAITIQINQAGLETLIFEFNNGAERSLHRLEPDSLLGLTLYASY